MSYYKSNRRGPSGSYGGPGRSFKPGRRQNKPKHGEYINPSKFIKAAKTVSIEEYVPKNSFTDFQVAQSLKIIYKLTAT